MSDTIIDARGLSCPEPVVLTKKALDIHSEFAVLVDNETAKENVQRICDKFKASTNINATDDGWKISVSK